MRPVTGLVLLTLLAYGALAMIGIVLSLLTAGSTREMLFLSALGSILTGALLMTGERKGVTELSKRAYITGGGRGGDVRIFPRPFSGKAKQESSPEAEKLATPSGIRSGESIEGAVPRWLTGATVSLALLIAGVIMMVSVYLSGFG